MTDVFLSQTYSHNTQVPDSASTATAFLCGEKTNFFTIGVNYKTQTMNCNSSIGNELTSIAEWSAREGKKTESLCLCNLR